MDWKNEVMIESTAVSIGSKTTGGGALVGLVGFIAQINWIGVMGVIIALGGLAVNVYFSIRRDRRESRESEARIRAIEGRRDL